MQSKNIKDIEDALEFIFKNIKENESDIIQDGTSLGNTSYGALMTPREQMVVAILMADFPDDKKVEELQSLFYSKIRWNEYGKFKKTI
jgi:CBS domain containing-hemolysin-like protein